MKLPSAPTRNISSQTLAWSDQVHLTIRTCQSNIQRGFISIISNQQLPNQNYIRLCQEAFKEFLFLHTNTKGCSCQRTFVCSCEKNNNSALLQSQLDAEQNWSRPVFKNGYSKVIRRLLFYLFTVKRNKKKHIEITETHCEQSCVHSKPLYFWYSVRVCQPAVSV